MTTPPDSGVEIARAICKAVGVTLEGPEFIPQRIRLELDVIDPPQLTIEFAVLSPDTDEIATAIRSFSWAETSEEQP